MVSYYPATNADNPRVEKVISSFHNVHGGARTQQLISQRLDKKGCMVPSILQFQYKTNIKEGQDMHKTLFISNHCNPNETLYIKDKLKLKPAKISKKKPLGLRHPLMSSRGESAICLSP